MAKKRSNDTHTKAQLDNYANQKNPNNYVFKANWNVKLINAILITKK